MQQTDVASVVEALQNNDPICTKPHLLVAAQEIIEKESNPTNACPNCGHVLKND